MRIYTETVSSILLLYRNGENPTPINVSARKLATSNA
jgi:hypothetical protein